MIVLINPNSSVSMTEAMLQAARQAAPGHVIKGLTSHDGPVSIQGVEDGIAAVPPMLKLVEKAAKDGANAIIIGCFDDTGLAQARKIASCPVIGIGQAAYHLAAIGGPRFSVVTTLEASVPILETNIQAYGLASHCARVRASGVEVLDIENKPTEAAERILSEVVTAERDDDIDCIVLGCGGMVHLTSLIRENTNLRPIDGVRAAAFLSISFSQI
ncbi:aspartate/glutamate racemase family protein [uncultured Boseongicola sp.]|jgi:allantoin racemase|uniref:aspartate/glutamate racemase family protein n=1 Tax=uncultured Boseongicola sp. TaxID=1648499 RepID=UPI002609D5DC|nr:aspartate/glutamate racemase family protein [uncultured Boseongicola sp.]